MKKKHLFIGLILTLFVVGIIFILNSPPKELTNSEKKTALTQILGRKPVLSDKEVAKGNVEYKGKYVSIMYPARAKIYVLRVNGQVKKDNWNLDSLNFDLDDPRSTVLVTVSQAPGGVTSLNDYPSVRLRQIQPGLYQGKEIKIQNQSGLEFDKQDNSGFEKSAFFYINNKIYFFSFQGSDQEGIEELFKQMMSTVKFLP